MQPDDVNEHYELLRALARRLLGGNQGNGYPDPTEIVHECYLRMHQAVKDGLADPRQFRAYAAAVMRSVLVDWRRREGRLKRDGGLRITLEEAVDLVDHEQTIDLLDLDEALQRLAVAHPKAARVIELRFFGGLTEQETAEQLKVSRRTARTYWQFGRSWLARELSRGTIE